MSNTHTQIYIYSYICRISGKKNTLRHGRNSLSDETGLTERDAHAARSRNETRRGPPLALRLGFLASLSLFQLLLRDARASITY